MFENPKRSREARKFTTNVPKILDLKSSFEQIFSLKLTLGAPESNSDVLTVLGSSSAQYLFFPFLFFFVVFL